MKKGCQRVSHRISSLEIMCLCKLQLDVQFAFCRASNLYNIECAFSILLNFRAPQPGKILIFKLIKCIAVRYRIKNFRTGTGAENLLSRGRRIAGQPSSQEICPIIGPFNYGLRFMKGLSKAGGSSSDFAGCPPPPHEPFAGIREKSKE